jgi:hypothetical protein
MPSLKEVLPIKEKTGRTINKKISSPLAWKTLNHDPAMHRDLNERFKNEVSDILHYVILALSSLGSSQDWLYT